mgnify:CR=1 FL=1
MSDILAINTEEDYDQGTRVCKLPSMSVYTFHWKWNTWHGFWQNIKQWFDNRKAAKPQSNEQNSATAMVIYGIAAITSAREWRIC